MNKKPVFAYVLLGLFGFSLFVLVGYVMIKRNAIDPQFKTYEAERACVRWENLKQVQQQEMDLLTGYAWVDESKKVVRIPIERAMELELASLKAKQVRSGTPIVIPQVISQPVTPAPAAVTPTTPTPPPAPATSAPVQEPKKKAATKNQGAA